MLAPVAVMKTSSCKKETRLVFERQKKVNAQVNYLESPSKEFIFYFQEISFADIHLEWLIYNTEGEIILNVLPPSIAMSEYAS